jgi:hypothetical protein
LEQQKDQRMKQWLFEKYPGQKENPETLDENRK